MKKKYFVLFAILMVLSLVFTACKPKAETPAQPAEEGYPAPAVEEPVDGYPAPASAESYPAPASADPYPAPVGTITVATDATFPPFEMVDEATKELFGFDIDLMKAIAAEGNFAFEFVNLPFDPMLAGIAECQYDMAIAAITITDERKEQFNFSEPYIDAGQIIVVMADNDSINGKADLAGLTIGAQLGTTGEIEAKAIDGVNYKPYDTYDLAFLDLANDQIDAVIADYPTALGFISKNPERLKTVGEVFTDESYGIAICKDRADLLDVINPALQAVKDKGILNELAAKYLSGE